MVRLAEGKGSGLFSRPRTYVIVHRPWKFRKLMYWLMVPELAFTVTTLVLFALQQPDLFRTKLWKVGYDNGLNSDPNMIIYAYANHVPLPNVPFVWSESLTDYNVGISVLSLFVILTKMVMYIMHIFYPVVGTTVFFIQTILYAVSVYGQMGPDYADPSAPSPVAWYIRMGCGIATPYGDYDYCIMAKATFGVTFCFMCLYLTQFLVSVRSMWPDKNVMMGKDLEDDDDEFDGAPNRWEMQPQQTPRTPYTPYTPYTPFTPRTQAYRILNRDQKFA